MADEKDSKDKPHPIAEMFTVDDEAARTADLPEAEVNTDPPADKPTQERDEKGQFKGDGKKPEAKPDDGKKPEEKKAEEKPAETVPLAKFLEKTNELKAKLEAGDTTTAQLRKEIEELKAKLAPKPEEPAEPDYVADPKGYVDHKLKGVLTQIEAANKTATESGKAAQETANATQQQVHLNQIMGSVAEQERAFVAQTPDYYDALKHVRGIRIFQLREFDPQITDDQIRQVIVREETALAVQLVRQGKNPSEVAYRLAQQYGYQKKAPPADPTKTADPAASKLPDVSSRRLPPDQTLGTGSSPGDPEVYKTGETDPVDTALASLFPKRKTA